MPTVKSILRSVGLRGMILRFGEQWRTDETTQFENDVRTFYKKYQPYKAQKQHYPASIETDIDTIIADHGPILWPDASDRADQSTCIWLWRGGDIEEYPEDLFYSQHTHK